VVADEDAARIDQLEAEVRRLQEQQQATAEVIRVIAATQSDPLQVLSAIAASTVRILGSQGANIWLVEGDRCRVVAGTGEGLRRFMTLGPLPLTRGSTVGPAILDRKVVHIPDVRAVMDDEFPKMRTAYELTGQQAALAAPLIRDGVAVGGIAAGYGQPHTFTHLQIALLESFADQAAIAIENARLFQELQEANSRLEEASRHKSQFLANMSHELRTPLNAIIGYSEMLQEEAEDLDADAFLPDLQRINGAGKHLLGLINDILDLSKIEAGRMDPFLETFEISQMIRDVTAIVQPLMDKNSNVLVVECGEQIGTMHAAGSPHPPTPSPCRGRWGGHRRSRSRLPSPAHRERGWG
jgi:signal transduction histidine kinase